jgi:uncharacterized protein YjbI with pentapeptide repeats
MNAPIISDDPLYQLLRNDDVTGFNEAKSQGQTCNLSGCDLRGLDLRNLQIAGTNLEDTYFRGADLRGIDFRNCNLNGASLADAKISGCYFPIELTPDEIQLSVTMGTRLRHIYNKS